MKFLVFLLCSAFLLNVSAQTPENDDKLRLETAQKGFVAHFKKKDYDKARKPGEVLELSIRIYGADSESAAVAHANLGTVHRERGKFKEAVEQIEMAADIRSKRPDHDIPKRIQVIGLLATVQLMAKNNVEAEQNYLLATTLAEQAFGAGSKQTLEPVLNAANFFAFVHNYEKADEFYIKALRIAHERFGADAGKEKIAIENARQCLTETRRLKIETGDAYLKARQEFFDDTDLGIGVRKKAVKLLPPYYPPEARDQRLGGIIAVRVSVGEDGKVTNAQAACGHPVLVRSAEEAARKLRFHPTIKDGRPVGVTGIITYAFVPAR